MADNKIITNRDLMSRLDNKELSLVMWALYFRPSLWVAGNEAKKHSTPSDSDVAEWLSGNFKDFKEFWDYCEDNE